MDSSTKSLNEEISSQKKKSDLENLKDNYLETTKKLVPLLPTLLAFLDFRRTQNFNLVRERMKQGLYGTVKDEFYYAPTTGPYVGFMKDYNEVEMNKLKELLLGEKETS